jgi:hypothetical protein
MMFSETVNSSEPWISKEMRVKERRNELLPLEGSISPEEGVSSL